MGDKQKKLTNKEIIEGKNFGEHLNQLLEYFAAENFMCKGEVLKKVGIPETTLSGYRRRNILPERMKRLEIRLRRLGIKEENIQELKQTYDIAKGVCGEQKELTERQKFGYQLDDLIVSLNEEDININEIFKATGITKHKLQSYKEGRCIPKNMRQIIDGFKKLRANEEMVQELEELHITAKKEQYKQKIERDKQKSERDKQKIEEYNQKGVRKQDKTQEKSNKIKEVGQCLKELIEDVHIKTGIGREEIKKKVGIHPNSLHNYKEGIRLPRYIKNIADNFRLLGAEVQKVQKLEKKYTLAKEEAKVEATAIKKIRIKSKKELIKGEFGQCLEKLINNVANLKCITKREIFEKLGINHDLLIDYREGYALPKDIKKITKGLSELGASTQETQNLEEKYVFIKKEVFKIKDSKRKIKQDIRKSKVKIKLPNILILNMVKKSWDRIKPDFYKEIKKRKTKQPRTKAQYFAIQKNNNMIPNSNNTKTKDLKQPKLNNEEQIDLV